MAKIIAVSRSKQKGTKKTNIPEGVLKENYGLAADAHADSNTHRQVSLLAIESIDKIRGLGFDVAPGDFAENLTTEGIDLLSIPVGARIRIGEGVILELTQIGKECHTGCAIYQQIGKCIMPKEGVFTKVVKGGLVKAGDTVTVLGEQGQ
ncbi:hypothetical protein ES707_14105 [subsurface metagenome]